MKFNYLINNKGALVGYGGGLDAEGIDTRLERWQLIVGGDTISHENGTSVNHAAKKIDNFHLKEFRSVDCNLKRVLVIIVGYTWLGANFIFVVNICYRQGDFSRLICTDRHCGNQN